MIITNKYIQWYEKASIDERKSSINHVIRTLCKLTLKDRFRICYEIIRGSNYNMKISSDQKETPSNPLVAVVCDSITDFNVFIQNTSNYVIKWDHLLNKVTINDNNKVIEDYIYISSDTYRNDGKYTMKFDRIIYACNPGRSIIKILELNMRRN